MGWHRTLRAAVWVPLVLACIGFGQNAQAEPVPLKVIVTNAGAPVVGGEVAVIVLGGGGPSIFGTTDSDGSAVLEIPSPGLDQAQVITVIVGDPKIDTSSIQYLRVRSEWDSLATYDIDTVSFDLDDAARRHAFGETDSALIERIEARLGAGEPVDAELAELDRLRAMYGRAQTQLVTLSSEIEKQAEALLAPALSASLMRRLEAADTWLERSGAVAQTQEEWRRARDAAKAAGVLDSHRAGIEEWTLAHLRAVYIQAADTGDRLNELNEAATRLRTQIAEKSVGASVGQDFESRSGLVHVPTGLFWIGPDHVDAPDFGFGPQFQAGAPTGRNTFAFDESTTGVRGGVGLTAPLLRYDTPSFSGFQVPLDIELGVEGATGSEDDRIGQIDLPNGINANIFALDGSNAFFLNTPSDVRFDYDRRSIGGFATLRTEIPIARDWSYRGSLSLRYERIDTDTDLRFTNQNQLHSVARDLDWNQTTATYRGGVAWHPSDFVTVTVEGTAGFAALDTDLQARQQIGNLSFRANDDDVRGTFVGGAHLGVHWHPFGMPLRISATFDYQYQKAPFTHFPESQGSGTSIGYGDQHRYGGGIRIELPLDTFDSRYAPG